MVQLVSINRLLSTLTSSSGIETLEIDITWNYVRAGCGKDLFSSDARKVVLSLGLEMVKVNLEAERNLYPSIR